MAPPAPRSTPICLRGHQVDSAAVSCAACGSVVRFAPGVPSVTQRIGRYTSWLCFALLLIGTTLAATLGHGAKDPAQPRIAVTAENGYTVPEASFLNYLGQVDVKLVQGEAYATLYAVGQSSCANFGRGDTQDQVFKTEKASVQRKGFRISAAQVGELVPVAVLKLCPTYLPTITTTVA